MAQDTYTTLATVTAADASAAATAVTLPRTPLAAAVQLHLSAAASTVADTLNVRVQYSLDEGTTYDDFLSFTQQVGNGGAVKEILAWNGFGAAPEDEVRTPTDGSLAAANVMHNPVGRLWRVKYAITDDSGSAAFTFTVKANIVFAAW